jgi:glycerol uptake facilitator-like aquaporin
MSGDPAITTLIISATYVAVVAFTESGIVMTGSPFNPAAALGLTVSILFQSDLLKTRHVWVFLIFSYIGSMLAVVLFEFVYKRAMIAVDEVQDDDEEERQEHDALISP